MLREHEIEIRVRYQETDAQGRVHHGNYATWFEAGRVELLRASGLSYRDLEDQGVYLVLRDLTCRFHLPVEFDDLIKLRTITVKSRGVRIENRYEVIREGELAAEGRTVVACVSQAGKVRPLPELLRID